MDSQPYNIILAGRYGVGKSSLFNFLSREQSRKSIRSWDKWEHVMRIGKEQVQVVLWDTAGMEKNNIFSMSQSYFTQCVGVILVYKKGDLSTLFALDQWVQRAMESQWSSSIVFSLWCNDMGSYSSDEITPEHREQLIAKWKIPPELVFDINASDDDGRNVMQIYRQVVAAIRQKVVGDRTSASSHLSERVSTPDADERIALSADSSEHSQHTANQRRCLGKC